MSDLRVINILPPQTVPGVQSPPVASATNSQTPSSIASLTPGTLLSGFIINRDAGGNPILRTDSGDITFSSNFFLKIGSEVTIRVENIGGNTLAHILSVDGQSPEAAEKQSAFSNDPQIILSQKFSSPIANAQTSQSASSAFDNPTLTVTGTLVSAPPAEPGAEPSLPVGSQLTLKIITLAAPTPAASAMPTTSQPLPTVSAPANPGSYATYARASGVPAPLAEIAALASANQVEGATQLPQTIVAGNLPPSPTATIAPASTLPNVTPTVPNAIVAATTGAPGALPATNAVASTIPSTAAPLPATNPPTPQHIIPVAESTISAPQPITTVAEPAIATSQPVASQTSAIASSPATVTVAPATSASVIPSATTASFTPAPPAISTFTTTVIPAPAIPAQNTVAVSTPLPLAASPAPVPNSALTAIPAAIIPAQNTVDVTTSPPITTASPGIPMPTVAAPAPPAQNISPASAQPGQSVTATVIGTEPSGETLVQSSIGVVRFPSGTIITPGSKITFELTQVTPPMLQALPNQPLLPLPLAPITELAQQWTAVQQIFALLGGRDTSTGLDMPAPFVQNPLAPPPTGGGITPQSISAGMMSFMAAIKGANFRNWLGSNATRWLQDNGHGEVLKKAESEFMAMSRQFTEAQPNHWQPLFFPVAVDGMLQQVRLFIKRDRQQNKEGKPSAKKEDTRFVVEVDLSQLGEMQLDGFVRHQDSGVRFDLMIRSLAPLAEEFQQDIFAIYNNTAALTGYTGSLAFQSVREFPVNPMEDIVARGMENVMA